MAKKLFIIISDGGDGSYYPKFTMDEKLIGRLEQAYKNGSMHYGNGMGCDGDGFHYEILTVPDECTYESLGITRPIANDYADRFFPDEEDEGYGGGHDS